MDDVKIDWSRIEKVGRLAPEGEIGTLIGRIAGRDREALKALHQLVGGKILALLRGVFADGQTADDVLVDVFVRIWTEARRFQTCEAHPVGWLFAIVRLCVRERAATDVLSEPLAGPEAMVELLRAARIGPVEARPVMPDAPLLAH